MRIIKCTLCDKVSWARRLCKNHYDKWLKQNNESYRAAQIENCKKWSIANQERVKNNSLLHREKEKLLPNYAEIKRANYLKRRFSLSMEQYEKINFGFVSFFFNKPFCQNYSSNAR